MMFVEPGFVLACAAWMAFTLEHIMFVEPSLVLVGIKLARSQILKLLVGYLM